MRCPIGGGLGGIQGRFLSVSRQMSIFVLNACCLAGALVVPWEGLGANPGPSDG
jgi:hypothetical protein